MTGADWVAIAALCFSGAATPGPSLAVIARAVLLGGASRGIATAVGHGIGVGIYATVAVAGYAAVLAAAPGVISVVELGGAALLVWMGVGIIRSASDGALEAPEGAERARARGFAEGFVFAFMNPKIILFFVAILGAMVPPESTAVERTMVGGVAMTVDAVWYIIAALALSRPGARSLLEGHRKRVQVALGGVLIAAGAVVALL